MTRLRCLVAAAACLLPLASLAAECRGTDLMERFKRTHPAFVSDLAAQAAAIPHGRGKLFRLAKDGVAQSFLFGTVHAADPRVVAFSPALKGALAEAKAVALELADDPESGDPFAQMKPEDVERLLLATPDQKVQKLLSAADLRRLEAAAAPYGMPPDMVRAFRPSILATFMAIPACASARAGTGGEGIVDARIHRMAKAAGKPVIGLETFTEQLEAMHDFPTAVQKQLIVATVRHLPESENMFETLLALYGRGEIGLTLAWARSQKPIPTIDARVPTAFYDVLIDRRNARMVERAAPLVAAGGAFVAVGAAHLPGETGLVRGFEKAGYTATLIE